MRPALVVRLAGHRDLAGRRARVGRALEAEAVDLEWEAVGGQRVAPVGDPEVQVRSARVPAVAEQAELLPGRHALSDLDADRAGLHVEVMGEHAGSDLDHDAVAPEVRRLGDGRIVELSQGGNLLPV